MKLAEQLRMMPFLRVFVVLTTGMLAARFITAPDGMIFLTAGIIYGAAWYFHRRPWGQSYLLAAIGMTGVVLSVLSDIPENIPRGKRLALIVQIQESPVTQGRWRRTTAHVGYFRSASTADSVSVHWQPSREKIQLYVDTLYQIQAGETISLFGYLNPIAPASSSYGRLMRSRDLSARCYLTPGNFITRAPEATPTLSQRAATLQQWAVERLSRLALNDTDRNLLITLLAGERRSLDRTLRDEYARTGVSHILSVSGLHMGFVFVLVNLLTAWIVMFRRGHLIRNGLVIITLWIYAAMAGLSPPVIRAALMMTLAQLALGFSLRGDRYNLLLGAATLMLAIHPHYLFDISFQLSFLAVLSILFLYPRLYRRRLSRIRWLDALWSSLLLGVAAQIGTLPLVAYSFGNLPLIAVWINPPVVLCSFLVVSAGFLWLIFPLSWLAPILSRIIATMLHLQNTLIERASQWSMAAIDDLHPNGWLIVCIYFLLILLAIVWKLHEQSRQVLLKE